MTRQIEKFFYSKAIRLTDYPAYRVYYHDMWFDGNGYSSNQRYRLPMYYAISDKASIANILRTLRADGILPRGKHFFIDQSTETGYLIENNDGSQMYELEVMKND